MEHEPASDVSCCNSKEAHVTLHGRFAASNAVLFHGMAYELLFSHVARGSSSDCESGYQLLQSAGMYPRVQRPPWERASSMRASSFSELWNPSNTSSYPAFSMAVAEVPEYESVFLEDGFHVPRKNREADRGVAPEGVLKDDMA